jgi:hypothetical protein
MESVEFALLFAFAAVVHGLLMAVDEFWFHRRRGLGRWERVSHPIDTAVFLFCLGLLLFSNETTRSEPWFFWLYGISSGVSCLLITKDEWVHAHAAPPIEQWLHSLLFILHPILLIAAWQGMALDASQMPQVGGGAVVLNPPWDSPCRSLVAGVFVAGLLFGLYQIIFWFHRPLIDSNVASASDFG